MTKSATAFTSLSEGDAAGRDLGQQINRTFKGQSPDALILFASARYDYTALLKALDSACSPRLLVGCSSAGEFTSANQGEGAASALALWSDSLVFTATVGRGLRTNQREAAAQLVAGFKGISYHNHLYRTALVLTDALAGQADALLEQLTALTAGTYQFFGGGAGDDGKFSNTHIFYGTEALPDAVVALEILSNTPLGIGVSHGWQPATPGMRVTETEAMSLISVNAMPALEVFEEHAENTGQPFDGSNPLPFFLHNIIGIESADGYKLRVPLGIAPEKEITLAAEVATGSTMHIMTTSNQSAADAAAVALRRASQQLHGQTPEVALFFDCVATRLRMGQEFGLELKAVQAELGPVNFVGFNTYGQIACAEGQFNGFHNCTAVVCLIPE